MATTVVRRRLICVPLAALLAFQSLNCGTIFHNERIGQKSGKLDPTIVALNAAGLLLFVVPGAIAFAVDFYNGTIYLPPEEYADARGQSPERTLRTIQVNPANLTHQKLEDILTREIGKPIPLDDPEVQVRRLESLDEFPLHKQNQGRTR